MKHIGKQKHVVEEFWSAFSPTDRERLSEEDFVNKKLYSLIGHSEVVGYFRGKLMRVDFAEF